MKHRILGQGLEVSALGVGCMPMAGVGANMYGRADEAESIATLREAIDCGVTFFDTAQIYGPFENEEILAKAIRGRREGLVIATKFGFRFTGTVVEGSDGSPANARAACDASLKRLSIDTIDLFYLHRVDPDVPIEESVGGMAELVQAGKVRHIGLSETSADTLRRAAATHPIAALQSEYSLWERDIEAEILPACRDLGIGFVPYSPLGRGFLTGQIASIEDLPADDYRRRDPRYAAENFAINFGIVDGVRAIAERHRVSPAQVALAWLLAQGDDIVPIPGTKRRETMRDSMAATEITLSAQDLSDLDTVAPRGRTAGPRYGEAGMRLVRI